MEYEELQLDITRFENVSVITDSSNNQNGTTQTGTSGGPYEYLGD